MQDKAEFFINDDSSPVFPRELFQFEPEYEDDEIIEIWNPDDPFGCPIVIDKGKDPFVSLGFTIGIFLESLDDVASFI